MADEHNDQTTPAHEELALTPETTDEPTVETIDDVQIEISADIAETDAVADAAADPSSLDTAEVLAVVEVTDAVEKRIRDLVAAAVA